VAEKERIRLKKRYEEPTWLVDVSRGEFDFEILCDGVTEIEVKPNGTKIITCKGRTIYREPPKKDRVLRFFKEVSEP